ncbi:hypothetical protein RB195_022706 [Necator americanus]|uniref:Uncharacterized protein n=1 Tax=Necator americanus TaxID=51031 RepID=A0ABR1EG96_NECAM
MSSELARLSREPIKEDLKKRRAEVLAEAAEAGTSIRYVRRDRKTKTIATSLRQPRHVVQEDAVKRTKMFWLCAYLFNSTVPPSLTYGSETWVFRKQEENAIIITEREIEKVMLGVTRFMQVKEGFQSSLLRHRLKIRDAAVHAKESKIRWTGHVMRLNDNRWTRGVSD